MAGDERGFTIVEVMVAAFVLLVGVLSMLALFDRANAATRRRPPARGGHVARP